MLELFYVVTGLLTLILEAIIAYALVDDVYGITQLRRITKRRLRKYWKQFFKDSKKYHRRTK